MKSPTEAHDRVLANYSFPVIRAWIKVAAVVVIVVLLLVLGSILGSEQTGEPASGDLALGTYYVYYEDISGSRFVGGRDVIVSDKLSRYELKSWEMTLPAQWRTLPTDIVRRGEPTVPGVVKVSREEVGLVYDFLSINPRDMAIPNPPPKDP